MGVPRFSLTAYPNGMRAPRGPRVGWEGINTFLYVVDAEDCARNYPEVARDTLIRLSDVHVKRLGHVSPR